MWGLIIQGHWSVLGVWGFAASPVEGAPHPPHDEKSILIGSVAATTKDCSRHSIALLVVKGLLLLAALTQHSQHIRELPRTNAALRTFRVQVEVPSA